MHNMGRKCKRTFEKNHISDSVYFEKNEGDVQS